MIAYHPIPPAPAPTTVVNAAIIFTTAATVVALFLSLFVLAPPFLDLVIAADPAAWAATAAVLAAVYVAGFLGFRRATPPVAPEGAAALRAGAEVLVAAVWVSLMNLLLVLGAVPVTAAGAEEATTTLQASCVLAVFVVFTAGVLLLLLSVSRPIPETVSRWGIQALKLSGMMLMVVSLPFSVAFVCFGRAQSVEGTLAVLYWLAYGD